MAAPPREGPDRSERLRTGLTILAVLLGLSLSLDTRSLFPLIRGLQVSGEIVRTTLELRRLQASNDALEAEVKWLGTREGGMWAVTRYQGLVKPGQRIGRVVEAPQPESPPLTSAERRHAWIREREAVAEETLAHLGQVLSCYGRRRPAGDPSECNDRAGEMSKGAKPEAEK